MYNKNFVFTWPYQDLGPRKLNEKELLEIAIVRNFTNCDSFLAFKKINDENRKNTKSKLNLEYSRLGRLTKPREAEQLYKSYVKKCHEYDRKVKTWIKNTTYNRQLSKKIISIYDDPFLYRVFLSLGFISNDEKFTGSKIIPKKLWIAQKITETKRSIKFYTRSLKAATDLYNKVFDILDKTLKEYQQVCNNDNKCKKQKNR